MTVYLIALKNLNTGSVRALYSISAVNGEAIGWISKKMSEKSMKHFFKYDKEYFLGRNSEPVLVEVSGDVAILKQLGITVLDEEGKRV